MSDVKRLLAEATPLPWGDGASATAADGIYWEVTGPEWQVGRQWSPDDAALIVYAVNRLPDYEAAVEALERLLRFTHALTAADHEAPLRAGGILHDLYAAENALARLRESVPA